MSDYFSDSDTFIRSVTLTLKRLVGFDLLDEKKHFHLRNAGFLSSRVSDSSRLFLLSNLAMQSLRIGSLNINGGRDRQKRL